MSDVEKGRRSEGRTEGWKSRWDVWIICVNLRNLRMGIRGSQLIIHKKGGHYEIRVHR